MYRKLTKLTKVLTVIFTVCVALISYFYRIDHITSDLMAIDSFVKAEAELIYPDFDLSRVLNEMSVSAKLLEYNSVHNLAVWVGRDGHVSSISEARSMVNELLNGVSGTNSRYITGILYQHAYYDVIAMLDPECDDYYEIKCYILEQNSLIEPLYINSIYGWVILRVDFIVTILVIVSIATMAINIITLFTAKALKYK